MAPSFKPAWWLPSAHLQTIWPYYFRPRASLNLRQEQLELEDGDFLDLNWSRKQSGKPILLLHGLEGTVRSHYLSGLFSTLEKHGYRPVIMHFRGCGGRPNRLRRAYHSGDTGDLLPVINHIQSVVGEPVYAAVGFSLGANVLLKWLGETGADNPLTKAVAVSVPFRLVDAANRLDRGLSRFYRNYLLKSLRLTYLRKSRQTHLGLEVDVNKLDSFWDYDEAITAPLHGFESAEDYYTRSSSRAYLKQINTPTLIIHARDDPFMFADTAPDSDELSDSITLLLSQHGGHIGFVTGDWPWAARYWHEERITDYLA